LPSKILQKYIIANYIKHDLKTFQMEGAGKKEEKRKRKSPVDKLKLKGSCI